MKTKIKKIMLLTVALIIFGTGVSFAHESYHKPPGNAYGHYKSKGHPVLPIKNLREWQHPKRYETRCVHEYSNDYDRYRGGHEGSVFKLSVAVPDMAFKIVVKDRKF